MRNQIAPYIQEFKPYHYKYKIFKKYHPSVAHPNDVAVFCANKGSLSVSAIDPKPLKVGERVWMMGADVWGNRKTALNRIRQARNGQYNFWGTFEGVQIVLDEHYMPRDYHKGDVLEKGDVLTVLPKAVPGDSGGPVFYNDTDKLTWGITSIISSGTTEAGIQYTILDGHADATRNDVGESISAVVNSGPNLEFIKNCAPLVCGDDEQALQECDADIE